MNDEEKTQLNILFKNYKGVPFTDKDISYLEENEIVGISGNAMFQNDYIIFESILMDKIPKEKNTIFTFYPPDDGSPNETFSGTNYDSRIVSENIKSTFVQIDKTTSIYGYNITQNEMKPRGFCKNVLQYYDKNGYPILQKMIHLPLQPVVGTSSQSWFKLSNYSNNSDDNILKYSLPEFPGRWHDDVPIGDVISDNDNIDIHSELYKHVLYYSIIDTNTGKLIPNGLIPNSIWNFDLKNGIISFHNEIDSRISTPTPPLLTFVKYIGRKSVDLDNTIKNLSIFKKESVKITKDYDYILEKLSKANTEDSSGTILDLSGIGYIKIPFKDPTDSKNDMGIYKDLGAIRYDTVENAFEGYHGVDGWKSIGGGSGNTSDNYGTEIRISKKDEKEKINGEFNPGFYTHTIEFYTKDPLPEGDGKSKRRMIINKNGNIDISNNLKVDGSATINDLTIDNSLYISNNLKVDGSATIKKDLTIEDSVNISNNLKVNGSATINDLTVSQDLYAKNIYLDIDNVSVYTLLDNHVKDISENLWRILNDAPKAFDTLNEVGTFLMDVSDNVFIQINQDIQDISSRMIINKNGNSLNLLLNQSAAAEACVDTWTPRSASEAREWKCVCWSPELSIFVAVAATYSNETNLVMTSPDGITWTARSASSANYWLSVCWSPELSIFVAVGADYTNFGINRVMTSPDGETWSTWPASEANTWCSVCWSPELSIFVAVAADGTNQVMTSPDGETWTPRSASSAYDWVSVCWSPELSIFVAVSTQGYPSNGTNVVMTSPDGITWTARSASSAENWYSVCWSPELSIFVAVAAAVDSFQKNLVMTSPDGITWTTRSASEANTWYSVCWSPELSIFVAVSRKDRWQMNLVMTSPDGITWTPRSHSEANNWESVCWSPELSIFVAVAVDGTNRVMTSNIGMPTSKNIIKALPTQMSVLPNGNVGIGTTDPKAKLSINNGKIYFQGNDYYTSYGISFYHSSGSEKQILYYNSADKRTIIRGVNDGNVNETAGILFKNENGNDLMLLSSNGNVGIDTTDPQAKLHIRNYANTTSVESEDAYIPGLTGNPTRKPAECLRLQGRYTNQNGSGALLRFTNWHNEGQNPSSKEYNLAGIAGYDHDHNWGGGLCLYTAPGVYQLGSNKGGGNLIPRMIIDNYGNVGIGTTSPETLLTVGSHPPTLNDRRTAPYLGTRDLIRLSSYSHAEAFTIRNNDDASTGRLEFFWGNTKNYAEPYYGHKNNIDTSILTLQNNGNVGIGTTDPIGKLDIFNSTSITNCLAQLHDFSIHFNVGPNDNFVRNGMAWNYRNIFGGQVGITCSNNNCDTLELWTTGSNGRKINLCCPTGNVGDPWNYPGLTVYQNNVGIGTTSPTRAKLQIKVANNETMLCSDDISQFLWRIDHAEFWGIYWATNNGPPGDGPGNDYYMSTNNNPNEIVFVGGDNSDGNGYGGNALASISLNNGNILTKGDITAFYGSSDKRLKTNINTIENAVEIVQKLRGVRFNWNEKAHKINQHIDLEKKEIGVIAQEVEEHLPEVVKKGLSDYKAIRYEKITPLLIEAIKEQQQQIKAQQQQINEQKQQINEQQQQINEILNRLNQHNA